MIVKKLFIILNIGIIVIGLIVFCLFINNIIVRIR